MNSDYERDLERLVDRALKELPELTAPPTLLSGVMARLAARQAVPWYRQPLPVWPLGLRVAALSFLFALFGAVCVAAFELTRAAGFSNALHELSQSFSFVGSIWNVVNALLGAVVLVIRHLGTGFIVGCAVAAALGYAVCIGLGTACVRLAYARK